MAKELSPLREDAALQNQAIAADAELRPTLDPGLEQQVAVQDTGIAAPALEPPTGGIAAAFSAGGATAWGSQTVGRLWSVDQNRNSWVYVNNVGWRKLSTASESGVMAMTMLASSARQTNSPFNYRQEADDMIHEIYVW